MRVIFLLTLALIAGGCSHFPSASTTPVTAASCRIMERVYHEGWHTCGEISICPSGQYSWTVSDVWSTPRRSQSFTGQLPNSISQQLVAGIRSFHLRDGVRTYEVDVDDTKTQLPAGVDALRDYLHTTHLTK
jgi:hypothetical protein